MLSFVCYKSCKITISTSLSILTVFIVVIPDARLLLDVAQLQEQVEVVEGGVVPYEMSEVTLRVLVSRVTDQAAAEDADDSIRWVGWPACRL